MSKSNKTSYRVLRFIVIVIIMSVMFLNVTYGLYNVREITNEFIGTTLPETTTQPPVTPPPTTATQPTQPTQPPTTATQPTIEQTTEPPITQPPETASPTEPVIGTTVSTDNPAEPATPEDYEYIPDNMPPGSNQEMSDTSERDTDPDTIDYDEVGDNPPPGGNINRPTPPGANPPQTGDEDSDPRFWLMLLAVCAFTLRYILFIKKEPCQEMPQQ